MWQVESYRQIAIGDRLVGDSSRQKQRSMRETRKREGGREGEHRVAEEVEMKRLSTIPQVIRISGIV